MATVTRPRARRTSPAKAGGAPEPPGPSAGARVWWLFVHQLPPEPPGLRVKVWRRLQAIGALQIKGSIYVLPALDSTLEDLEWLAQEIHAAGAEASIWQASTVDGYRDEDLILRFRQQSAAEYEELAADATALLARVRADDAPSSPQSSPKRQHARLRNRFREIGQRDLFQAPRREVAGALLEEIQAALGGEAMNTGRSAVPALDGSAFQGKLWVTRAHVYVDRIACAWLIRRFIDRDARFQFVVDKRYEAAPGAIRFDMYEGEFTHEGDRCSFEVMLDRFGLDDAGFRTLAEVVHDIDLKDEKYGRPETIGIAAVLQGICRAETDDTIRLTRGAELFDDLYLRFGGQMP